MTVRLIHGDCLEILPTLAAGSVDAVITDPPYGMDKFQFDNEEWEVTKLLSRVLTDGVIYMFCGDNSYIEARTEIEKWFDFNRTIIWNKTVYQGGGYYQLSHEYILFATIGSHIVNTKYRKNTSLAMAQRGEQLSRDNSVWRFPSFNSSTSERNGHPTQKPLALIRRILSGLPMTQTILDPFMGSGTTGVACVETGRNFIGIEIDADYFKIAQRRIADAQSRMNGTARKVDSTVDGLPLFEVTR